MKRFKSRDKISELPDAVLGHILSFIPFKQSVQLSVLSKRWLHVWMYLPLVEVYDYTTSLVDPIVITHQSVHLSFINFMTKALDWRHSHRADHPLCKLILKCTKFDVLHINQWIIAAAKCRVRELDLSVTLRENYEISASLFAYDELASLKLGESFVLDVPGSLRFPSLRKLYLDYVYFDDETIQKFLSGCPALEDLHISACSWNWDNLVIEAPALKFFTISYVYKGRPNFKFVLDSPNLEVLNFSGAEALNGYCFGSLDFLVKANIDICMYDGDGDGESPSQSCIEIVKAISNAKIICLIGRTLELLSSIDVYDLPIFHNLTELRLGRSEYRPGMLVSQLFRNSPNLEVLVLDEASKWACQLPSSVYVCDLPIFHNLTELRFGLSNSYGCGEFFSQLLHNSPNLEVLVIGKELVFSSYWRSQWWKRPSSVPDCVARRLKVVNIWGYDDENTCFGDFINYVLENAKVLKECWSSLYESSLKKEIINHLTEAKEKI